MPQLSCREDAAFNQGRSASHSVISWDNGHLDTHFQYSVSAFYQFSWSVLCQYDCGSYPFSHSSSQLQESLEEWSSSSFPNNVRLKGHLEWIYTLVCFISVITINLWKKCMFTGKFLIRMTFDLFHWNFLT